MLFDGKDLSQWQSQDGSPATWVVRDGYVEVAPGTGAMTTKRGFGSTQLHIEWATPTPPKGEGQERGNSGVFLMTAYMSAEQGKTLDFPPAGIERFVPAVAKGTWRP